MPFFQGFVLIEMVFLGGITFGAPGAPQASKLIFTASIAGQHSLLGTITVSPVRPAVE